MGRNILYFSAVLVILSSACHRSQPKESATSYTKIDSLTETYLTLQDSLLHAWNVMVWDEQEKTKAMHSLLHLMHDQEGFDDQQLMTLEQRLGQLDRIRFTQKSLANSYVIEEYDFASNSLVSEILSLAEVDAEFMKKSDVQRLVDKVKIADQRVNDYRAAYDKAASSYNEFLEKYDDYLRDLDKDYSGEKRALFHMASD